MLLSAPKTHLYLEILLMDLEFVYRSVVMACLEIKIQMEEDNA